MQKTREKIKNHLLSGKKLTGLKAFEKWQTLSLPQHINALRSQGVDIVTDEKVNKKTGVRYAEYKVIKG